jgi:predicted metalloprotease
LVVVPLVSVLAEALAGFGSTGSAAEPYVPGQGLGAREDEWPIVRGQPPAPSATTEADAAYFLERNPFFDQSVPAVDCEVRGVNFTTASSEVLSEYLNDAAACLMDTWDPVVRAAGFELHRPSVTVFDGPEANTGCGREASGNAFYCSVDQQLYYANDFADAWPLSVRKARFIPQYVLAHEFGHYLQGRLGMGAAVAYRREQAATEEESAEWNRRSELQADCLAGLFLRSISAGAGMTDEDERNLRAMAAGIGDAADGGDHGQAASRVTWLQAGMDATNVSACQTYTVPATQVR